VPEHGGVAQGFDSAQPGGERTVPGGAARAAPALEPGAEFSARVASQLDDGRYVVEVQSRDPAAPARLVLDSRVPLPVGGTVGLRVREASRDLVLEVVDLGRGPATEAQRPSANQAARFEHSRVVLELMLDRSESEAAQALRPGARLAVEVRADGTLVLRPAGAPALEAGGPDMPLATALRGLPADARAYVLVRTATLAQDLEALPAPPGAQAAGQGPPPAPVHARAEAPLPAEGPLPEGLPLDPAQVYAATVREVQGTDLVVRVGGTDLRVTIPPQTQLQPGDAVQLQAQPAGVRLEAVVETEAPFATATQEAAPAADADEAALNTLLRRMGLPADARLRAAARALAAEALPVNRRTLELVLGAAHLAERGAEPSAQARAPAPEGAQPARPDPEALVRAAARLLARDVPVAAPLVRGSARLAHPAAPTDRMAEAQQALQDALARLQAPPEPTGGRPLPAPAQAAVRQSLSQAMEALAEVPLAPDRPEAAAALAAHARTFATPQLAAAAARIEQAMADLLAARPRLARFDALLGVLGELRAAQAPAPQAPAPGAPIPGPEALPMDALLAPQAAGAEASASPSASAQAGTQAAEPALGADEQALLESLLRLPVDQELSARARALVQDARPETLGRLQAALQAREQAAVQADPLLGRLAAAHEAVRGLQEPALAAKAQALAATGQERTVFVAEVPLTLAGQTADGRLSVYYRRGRGRGPGAGPWSTRVVLDLHTTGLGAVRGDLRFLPSRLDAVLGTDGEETTALLGSEAEALRDALVDRGFRPRLQFRVVRPPQPQDTEERARPAPIPPLPEAGPGPHVDLEA